MWFVLVLLISAPPLELDERAAVAAAAVDRGELELARAGFLEVLAADPSYELPEGASREARGYFRLIKSQRRAQPAPVEPLVAPSVKRPNTLAKENPRQSDYVWWTVATVSALAIVAVGTLAIVAFAAD